MVMPDTYFFGEQPYEYLSNGTSEMDLACWKIRQEQHGKLGQVLIREIPEGAVLESRDKDPNCQWPHSWGAMGFNKSALAFADPEMPHTGYMIPHLLEAGVNVNAKVLDGVYFDCGTPREYLQMLELLS